MGTFSQQAAHVKAHTQGWSHGLIGAVVAAWPAVSLVAGPDFDGAVVVGQSTA
ncbi:MAG TPA: hypothetical protein VHZ03_20605 [Trebonia sp.]|nr:hypothetical protein [Trebonia sp.]